MKKKILFLLAVFILSLPAVWSLFHPGFFPSHDGEWMVIRLSDFHRSLVSGQIPVRWAARLNHGYGYPVFNFLYPFSLYLGEFFYLFLGSFVNAIKLVFILSFVLSGVFIYLWLREDWGEWAGMASALLYIYTPYRFLDVYVRGSLGEAVAFIFPPLIFWSATKLVKKWNKYYLALGAIAFAGLISSHNTMAMLFSLVFGGWVVFRWLLFRQTKVFGRQLVIFFLGLMLSCFFWLPALYDKQFVFFDQATVSNFFLHFPTLRQLIVPGWGYGPSLPLSDQDTLSFQLGVINLIVFFVGALIFGLSLIKAAKRKEHLKKNFQTFCFLLVALVSFFLMLGASSWVWRLLPIYNLIQFPWRLLGLTTFASAVLIGALVHLIRPRLRAWVVIIGVIFLIFLNYGYTHPEYFVDRGEDYYVTNEGTTTVANEYLPIWVEEPPLVRAEEKVEIVSGRGTIENLVFDSKKINFDLETETEAEIQINSHYFPGWKATIDGVQTSLDYQNQKGVMRIKAEPGAHQAVMVFKETPIRLLADLVSLLGLTAILGLMIKRR